MHPKKGKIYPLGVVMIQASTGEALKAFNGLANYGNMVAAGTARTDNGFPKLFVNILLFDKNYVLIDAAWQQIDGGEQPVGSSTKLPHAYLSAELTAKEPGFAYLYISNESATLVDGYFDDVTMTHTPTNIVQYNEYYPFGLQTATSWARPTATGNNFLANGGTELNTTSSLYDLEYRSYDPVLGRMNGVDPMATKYASLSPYNFSFNDPVSFTDVTGADPLSDFLASSRAMEKWFDETMPSAMDYNGNGGWGGGAGYNSMMGGYGTAGYVGEYSLGGLIGSYNSNYGGPVYVNSGGATGHFASPTQLAWAQRQESEPLNATIEYDRNKYERVRLDVSNGIVAGYEVFWTPAMQNLVASLNSFGLMQGDYEVGLIGGGLKNGKLDAHFLIEGVSADGLQVIQTVAGSNPRFKTKLRGSFVDGGLHSPWGGVVPGKPYYNEGGIVYNSKSMSGSVDIYDAPLAQLNFKTLSFETAIIAINYNGTGSDKVLASFQWGFTNYGTPTTNVISLQPNVSAQFLSILKNDYPNYSIKN